MNIRIQINAVEFKNTSAHAIENVTLSVIATHGRVSCSIVDAKNRCSTGFPTKGYSGGMLSVSWNNHQNKEFEQQFIVQQPVNSDSATHYKLTLLLSEFGQLDTQLELIN
ncbi:hypothetical protein [Pseudoalteromonas sp. ZZD1]|uniref:hypothetical protein n=1 Tax=Pseudoalteromonas sp. ZZD1 TaxID=3139395 RepID=UPI003BAB6428